MEIKIFKDLNEYTLTSKVTKTEFDLVKKHRPAALKLKNKDGDDVFGFSYVKGKSNISAFGITFGAVSEDTDLLMLVGEVPENLGDGETRSTYVADVVGAALEHISDLEQSIPAVALEIKASREELIGTMTEV